MTTTPADEPAPRTAEQIEADLRRTREELTRTVDELAGRVDPRRHAAEAKDKAQAKATGFVDAVKSGDVKAIGAAVGAVAALGLAIAVSRRKS